MDLTNKRVVNMLVMKNTERTKADENVFVYFNLYASTKMLLQLDGLAFLNRKSKDARNFLISLLWRKKLSCKFLLNYLFLPT